ncbi:hypothetical protein NEHOM01_1565 [Nematocida homosporus]|uniref:uncharacterized protein n=1 Tax=Nematocida homosporus TaxID=1912981 RepID=UPI0022200A8A|nr:uncharacterized protein NEHOM01_1565 [Nematocida homosporus]KAI5186579.1 hypothetical protein NEHOM01_1565 [Nematocida homosporus]
MSNPLDIVLPSGSDLPDLRKRSSSDSAITVSDKQTQQLHKQPIHSESEITPQGEYYDSFHPNHWYDPVPEDTNIKSETISATNLTTPQPPQYDDVSSLASDFPAPPVPSPTENAPPVPSHGVAPPPVPSHGVAPPLISSHGVTAPLNPSHGVTAPLNPSPTKPTALSIQFEPYNSRSKIASIKQDTYLKRTAKTAGLLLEVLSMLAFSVLAYPLMLWVLTLVGTKLAYLPTFTFNLDQGLELLYLGLIGSVVFFYLLYLLFNLFLKYTTQPERQMSKGYKTAKKVGKYLGFLAVFIGTIVILALFGYIATLGPKNDYFQMVHKHMRSPIFFWPAVASAILMVVSQLGRFIDNLFSKRRHKTHAVIKNYILLAFTFILAVLLVIALVHHVVFSSYSHAWLDNITNVSP